MACRYKTAVTTSLALYRANSGRNLSKEEWHTLRDEASRDAEARGSRLSRRKLSEVKLKELCEMLAEHFKLDDEQKISLNSSLQAGTVTESQFSTFEVMVNKIKAGESVGHKTRTTMLSDTFTNNDLLDHAGFFTYDENGDRVARPHRSVESDTLPSVPKGTPSYELVEATRTWLGSREVSRAFAGDIGLMITLPDTHDRSFAVRMAKRRGKEPASFTVLVTDESHKAKGFDQHIATGKLASVQAVTEFMHRYAPFSDKSLKAAA